MADNTAQIAAIELILNGGAKATSVDGMSVSYDFAELRKRLAELKATDDATLSAGLSRPKRAVIKMPYFS
jgi:hypothetical protein